MQRDFANTTQQDPEAELIFHKAKEVHVKSEPEKQNYKYLTLKSTFFTPALTEKKGSLVPSICTLHYSMITKHV